MLNYPQTHPELVPIAEKVLAIIDQSKTVAAPILRLLVLAAIQLGGLDRQINLSNWKYKIG